ncbi:MAG: alpha/beta hydrolase [Candidatus Nanopelagicales bacterium]
MELEVHVPGGSLHVVDDGAGRPVVLLHAGVADSRSWDAMVPHLVEAGLRVVRYDARGFGRTTTDDVEFSNVEDLVAVLDHLGIDKALLVGNSRGGLIAFNAALDRPDRVVGVIGVAAALGGFTGTSTPLEEALFEELERLESQDPMDIEAIAELDVAMWVDGPGQPPTRVDPAIREYVREVDRSLYSPDRVAGRWSAPARPAVERLEELSVPVVAVVGLLDVTDFVQTAEHLERHAPDAVAVLWPDVAHMIGMEVPDRLAALVVDAADQLGDWS